MTDNTNNLANFICISINDSSMSFESEKIQDLAKQINEIHSGRKQQDRGSELLFLFSFKGGILLGSGEKKFLKELNEEEQCIFFQNLKINY